MVATTRRVLSLADLEAFDPYARGSGRERRFLCPACGAAKPRDEAHRCLTVNVETRRWCCHRCAAAGQLAEWWQPRPAPGRRSAPRTLSVGAVSPDHGATTWKDKIVHPPVGGATPGPERGATIGKSPVVQPSGSAGPPEPEHDPTIEKSSIVQPSLGPAASEPEHDPTHRNIRYVQTEGVLQPLSGTPGEAYLQRRGIARCVAALSDVAFCAGWYGGPAVVFPLRNGAGERAGAQGRYIDARPERLRPAGANDWNDLLLAHGVDGLREALSRHVRPGGAAAEMEEQQADEILRGAWRQIGQTVPAGAIPWADAHRRDLMAAADDAEARLNAGYDVRDPALLPAAAADLLRAYEAVAAAFTHGN